MATISSAEPMTLHRYCTVLAPMDGEVVRASGSLAHDLASFEASCTEYPVQVGHLADSMRAHGQRAGNTDEWVKWVGDRFLWADQGIMVSPPTPALPVPTPDQINRWYEWLINIAEALNAAAAGAIGAIFVHMGKGGVLNIGVPAVLKGIPGIKQILRALKWIAGLKPGATRALPSSLTKGFGNAAWIFTGVSIALAWISDLNEYNNSSDKDSSKLVSALAVDAILELSTTGLAIAAGALVTWLAGAAVLAITGAAAAGGVAVAIGVAAILVSIGVALGAKWLVDKHGLREKAVAFVDETIDPALEWVQEQGKRSAAWMDEHIFQPVSDAIVDAGARVGTRWIDGAASEVSARLRAVQESAAALIAPPWGAIAGGIGGVLPIPNRPVPVPVPTPSPRPAPPSGPAPSPRPEPPVGPLPQPPAPPVGPTFPQLEKVIEYLDVENRAAYQPYQKGDTDTYCNVYASDVAHLSGALLPQTVYWSENGRERTRELRANQMFHWLHGTLDQGLIGPDSPQGPQAGWKAISADEAAQRAAQGNMVVVAWENPAGEPGHIAIVRTDSEPGAIKIAQAGKDNFSSGSVQRGFEARPVDYFVFEGTPQSDLKLSNWTRNRIERPAL